MSNQKKAISLRVIVQMLFFIVVIPILPLLISQRWNWVEAWVYAILCILGFAISRVLAARLNPDLLVKRTRFMQHEDAKPWYKLIAPLVGLGGGLVPLVAGLDAVFGWSAPFVPGVKCISLVIIVAGYSLGSYALVENRYFSGMVRIQTDRAHKVVPTGPYRWMRHPGYAGALLTYQATPLLLDSQWAFIPALFLTTILVIRTRLEDKTLQEELEGYKDYAKLVKYRLLLPGLW